MEELCPASPHRTICFQKGEAPGAAFYWQSSAPLLSCLPLSDCGGLTGRRRGNREVKGRRWPSGSREENLASPGCGEGLGWRESQGWYREE